MKEYEISQHGLSDISDDIGKIEDDKMKLEMALIEDRFQLKHLPTVEELTTSDFAGTILLIIVAAVMVMVGIVAVANFVINGKGDTPGEVTATGIGLLVGLLFAAVGAFVCFKFGINLIKTSGKLFGSKGIVSEKSNSLRKIEEDLRKKIAFQEEEVENCNVELKLLYEHKKQMNELLQSKDFWTETAEYSDYSKKLRSDEENFFEKEVNEEAKFAFSLTLSESEEANIQKDEIRESVESHIKWIESDIKKYQKELKEIQRRKFEIEDDYEKIKKCCIIFGSCFGSYVIIQTILVEVFKISMAAGVLPTLIPCVAIIIFFIVYNTKWESSVIDYLIEHDKKIIKGYALSNNRVPLYRDENRLKNNIEIGSIKLNHMKERLKVLEEE